MAALGELPHGHRDDSFRRPTSFLPKNLLWSWTLKPFLDALSPGMYAFCTLGHIFDPARRRQFPGEAQNTTIEARRALKTPGVLLPSAGRTL